MTRKVSSSYVYLMMLVLVTASVAFSYTLDQRKQLYQDKVDSAIPMIIRSIEKVCVSSGELVFDDKAYLCIPKNAV